MVNEETISMQRVEIQKTQAKKRYILEQSEQLEIEKNCVLARRAALEKDLADKKSEMVQLEATIELNEKTCKERRECLLEQITEIKQQLGTKW